MAESKKSSGSKPRQNRKSSPAVKKTKTRKRTKKAKKPKVLLSTKKVTVMCACICAFCALFLGVSVLLNNVSSSSPLAAKPDISALQKESAKEIKKTAAEPVRQETEISKKPAVQDKPSASPVKKEVKKETVRSPENSHTQNVKNTQKPAVKETHKTETPAAAEPPKVKAQAKAETKQKEITQAVKSAPPAAQKTPVKKQGTSEVASAVKPSQEERVQEQAKKTSRFDIPPAVKGAVVVIIIDDAGRSVENTRRYAELPFPVTVAVLPRLAHSRECADVVRNNGKEVILHQPMQSLNHKLDPGPGKITVDMSFSEISSIINENLLSLGPGVKGLNNHEGSEVTEDVLRIGAVLDTCSEKGIYFLDSRTTANTKAPQAALERDIKIFEKAGPYIDNELTREKMLERMYETLRYANNHGKAIVIGHVDKSVNILPELLSEMYPYMKQAGYRFATPSMLR